jgi:hypothetical protein
MALSTAGTSHASVPAPAAGPHGLLDGRRWLLGAFGLFLGLMTLMLVTGETGPGALRNHEPLPSDLPVYHYNGGLRANAPFAGWTGWIYLWQAIGFGGGGLILGTYGWRSWRDRRMHPMLAVSFAAGGMYAFDPFYNWLGYFPTNPAYLHVPHGALPWSDLAPTFEPVFFFPLYIVWLVLPALLAHKLWNVFRERGFRKRGLTAFMTRHPLLSLIVVCKMVTFPLDLGGFRLGCVTEAFIFSQAPGPMISGGTTGQAQLLWEPLLFELTMMGTTLLLYHGRDGLTVQQRVARRLRSYRTFPYLSEFAVAWCVVALTYVVCLSGMAALRFSGQGVHLGKPWPYLDTQVYDPDGLFKAACIPGEKRTGAGNFDVRRPAATGPCATP